MNNLILIADTDCVFYLDGIKQLQLSKGYKQAFPLCPGEYTLNFVSVENPNDSLWVEFEMPDWDSIFEVNLSSKKEVVSTKKKEAEIPKKSTKAKKTGKKTHVERKSSPEEADQALKKKIKVLSYLVLFLSVSIGAVWVIDSTIEIGETLGVILCVGLFLLFGFSLEFLIIYCIVWIVRRIKRWWKNRKK